MSAAGSPPGAEANAAGAIGAAEITLAFDQATVDLDALQRSAYAVAAEMTVDIRVCGADTCAPCSRAGGTPPTTS